MMSDTISQVVGSGVALWSERTPLLWVMEQPSLMAGHPPDSLEFDLRGLEAEYEHKFLLAVKESLLLAKHRKRLISIHNEYSGLKHVLSRVASSSFNGSKRIENVDSGFLVTLHTIAPEVPKSYLGNFRSFYKRHQTDQRLFATNLNQSDIPSGAESKYGSYGKRIRRILAQAMRKATLVHLLNVVESAFEERRLDIGRYAFIRLALNIFCRPDSYRRLVLSDLRIDTNLETGAVNYFLDVPPAKSRVHKPQKITYRLHPEVGRLLALQRKSVADTLSHLAPTEDGVPAIGRIALFPSMTLTANRTAWRSNYSNERSGQLRRESFDQSYLKPIKALASTPISFNGLRHTIGTQLAQMGCSSHTIQAVLKHACDQTASSYVDIVFEGLIDELSDGLEPAFNAHFPVVREFVSSSFAIPRERQIESDDLDNSKTAITGMCGRLVACSYAPLSCYDCPRFIPCYDADHSINLNIVNKEIEAADGKGLAMLHEVLRWKNLRNHIRVVMSACEIKIRAIEVELSTNGGARV